MSHYLDLRRPQDRDVLIRSTELGAFPNMRLKVGWIPCMTSDAISRSQEWAKAIR